MTDNETGNKYLTNCIHHQVCQGAYNCQTKCQYFEERPKGEWITDSVGNITCSNCGFSLGSKVVKLLYPFDFPYCLECGAKMKGDTDCMELMQNKHQFRTRTMPRNTTGNVVIPILQGVKAVRNEKTI